MTDDTVLHPLGDETDAPRWADVARQNGHTMHAGVQWEAIRPDGPSGGRGYPGDLLEALAISPDEPAQDLVNA